MFSPPAPPPLPPAPLTCEVYPGDYTQCRNDPAFIASNHSGCCPYGSSPTHMLWKAGVCDLCNHKFTCPEPPTTDFQWGAMLAIFVNIAIAVGMALQKTAHTDVKRRNSQSAKMAEGTQAVAATVSFTETPTWWMGFLLQVGGEIGNLIAYGDANTPSSVVASLGCVGVIANAVISAQFLGEGWRQRDAGGIAMIVLGVILVIIFVPHAKEGGTRDLLPCPIAFSGNYSEHACKLPVSLPTHSFAPDAPRASGVHVCETHGIAAVGSDYWYWGQPEWLVYFGLQGVAFLFFYKYLQRHGPVHPASFLILADIAGGMTVCASVTISTFLFAMVFAQGKWFVLAEPIFWLSVIILAITLPVQVNYLNKALEKYDVSIVVPTHYVLFTLASIFAPSILYQELTLDGKLLQYWPGVSVFSYVFFFTVGVILTCTGVVIVSGGKVESQDPENPRQPALQTPRPIEGVELRSTNGDDNRVVRSGRSVGASGQAKGQGLAAKDGARAIQGFDDELIANGAISTVSPSARSGKPLGRQASALGLLRAAAEGSSQRAKTDPSEEPTSFEDDANGSGAHGAAI